MVEVACENDRCIWSACLALGVTIGEFAGLAALSTGQSKDLFLNCSPVAHAFIEQVEKGEVEVAIIASAPKSDYEQAPEGLHQGVCVDVVDRGMVKNNFDESAAPYHAIRSVWELEETDSKGRRYRVMQQYRLSLHEKAKLRQHLEAWRGKKFTADELKGFDVEKLIGANCQLTLVHNGDYTNIQAIVPLAKGMTKMAPSSDYVRVKDRPGAQPPPADDGNASEDVPF
jgi:hypothetical protein